MIVLDTHVLIWWVAGSKKIPAVTQQLLDAEASSAGEVHVSAISAWEIAMLVRAGRLELTRALHRRRSFDTPDGET